MIGLDILKEAEESVAKGLAKAVIEIEDNRVNEINVVLNSENISAINANLAIKRYIVKFNPTELSIIASGGEKVVKKSADGGNTNHEYVEMKSNIQLNVKLIIDEEGNSVKKQVEDFISTLKNNYTRKIAFNWGAISYKGILNNVEAEYTMFSAYGSPIRAIVDLRINCIDNEAVNSNMEQWGKKFKEAFSEDKINLKSVGRNAGNINKAMLLIKGKYALYVKYNPSSIKFSTQADNIDKKKYGKNQKAQITAPAETSMNVELIFDESLVRTQIDGLIALITQPESRSVTFYWGEMVFTGALTNVSAGYTMFNLQGEPTRGKVTLTILQSEAKSDSAEKLNLNSHTTSTYQYDKLKKEYSDFENPVIVLMVNGKDFKSNKKGFVVSDIEIELTCGYEASIATFSIYNVFEQQTSKFLIEDVKKYICLGSAVELALGYGSVAKPVFCGFISKVNFIYEKGEVPGVKITAMDVKGIMMANNYSKQLTAKTYGAAIKEIFNKNAYVTMNNKKIIKQLEIDETPDKKSNSNNSKEDDRTIEMVCESDYEFVVRAAKKYNYEFFSEQGIVHFRKAKSNNKILMNLSPATGLKEFDVGYDITGLVEQIQARGMDTGKAKLIEAKKKFNNKISIGNKAKQYIKKSEKVYIDSTIDSNEEADYRVQSLMENMSYRFGTLECSCVGIPELMPGRFIKLEAIGYPLENDFYIVNVKHRFSEERGYETLLIGKAASIGGNNGLV